jgi:transcriptional regulator CtsR
VIIDEIKNSIPNIVSKKFKEKIIKGLINRDIFEYNAKLMTKLIQTLLQIRILLN